MATATSSSPPTFKQLPCPKEKLCAMCKKHDVELKTCGRCHGAWYCSRACQEADWKLHKLLCKAYSKAVRPQDGQLYCRAILFHPRMKIPEIHWLDCPFRDGQHDLMGKGQDPSDVYCEVAMNSIWPMHPSNGVDGYEIEILRREQAQISNPTTNESLAAAIASLSRTPANAWKGPVVVSRMGLGSHLSVDEFAKEVDPRSGKVAEDITMADFRRAVEGIADYRSDEDRIGEHPTIYLPYRQLRSGWSLMEDFTPNRGRFLISAQIPGRQSLVPGVWGFHRA